MPTGRTVCLQPKVASSRVLLVIVLVAFLDCLAAIAVAKLGQMLGLAGQSVQTEIVLQGLY